MATIPTLQGLTLSSSTIDFGTLSEADLDLGYRELLAAQQLTIKSNRGWALTIKANAATWTFVPSAADADPSKACADLEWKASSGSPKVTAISGSYGGATTSEVQVAAGDSGANIDISMDFRMLTGYVDNPPGDYSLTVVYTISSP